MGICGEEEYRASRMPQNKRFSCEPLRKLTTLTWETRQIYAIEKMELINHNLRWTSREISLLILCCVHSYLQTKWFLMLNDKRAKPVFLIYANFVHYFYCVLLHFVWDTVLIKPCANWCKVIQKNMGETKTQQYAEIIFVAGRIHEVSETTTVVHGIYQQNYHYSPRLPVTSSSFNVIQQSKPHRPMPFPHSYIFQ